jgi:hypothetical protein
VKPTPPNISDTGGFTPTHPLRNARVHLDPPTPIPRWELHANFNSDHREFHRVRWSGMEVGTQRLARHNGPFPNNILQVRNKVGRTDSNAPEDCTTPRRDPVHHRHGDVDCLGCSHRTEPLNGRSTHRSDRTDQPSDRVPRTATRAKYAMH